MMIFNPMKECVPGFKKKTKACLIATVNTNKPETLTREDKQETIRVASLKKDLFITKHKIKKHFGRIMIQMHSKTFKQAPIRG